MIQKRTQNEPKIKAEHSKSLSGEKSLLHASLRECFDHFDITYNIGDTTKVQQKPHGFSTFSFFVVVLFNRLVAKSAVDFALIFGIHIAAKSIKNE